ncbi:MAG: (d)CMP kinase [Acidobacteria bacterium]|nr:(d)CMP kinase [Acidobacteriota bacterium]MCB9378792.1 (d)CMP kinase [Holophagales bacterium]
MVVAIDGPAGVGKSTVARLVAERLGVPYLDTGAMYRALALWALEHGLDPTRTETALAAAAAAKRLAVRVDARGRAEILLDGAAVEPRIRAPEVAVATSRLAVHPAVRDAMVALQRSLAAEHGGVLEGRDIGTRVVPETPHKFYFDADAEIRAERRWRELAAGGDRSVRLEEIAAQLAERDERDRTRSASPLVAAADAERIDTGAATPEELVERIVASVRDRRDRRAR